MSKGFDLGGLLEQAKQLQERLSSVQSESTIHMTMPPINRAIAITKMLSRFLPITFDSKNAGTAVTTNAIIVRLSGCVSTVRSPRSPEGNVRTNFVIRFQK